jgi:hypothetical protein
MCRSETYGVYDPKYADANLNIHNYFIVRGLDLLKPGGVMMVITSSATRWTAPGSTKAREMMAERADLGGRRFGYRIPRSRGMRALK